MECKRLIKSRVVHCIPSARQLKPHLSALPSVHLLALLLAQPLPHLVTLPQAQPPPQLRYQSAYSHFAMPLLLTNSSWKALKIACLALTINEEILEADF